MGTCYSSHSQTGKRTYPSDMSINSDRSNRVPLPRPAYTGHSNKMPEKPGDRAALTPRSQSATRLPLPRGEASLSNRFGFKKSGLPTAKGGVMRSTDSIDSAASDVSRSSSGSQQRSLGPSYAPRESKAWKMIDDSSTQESCSQSIKSKSTRSSVSNNTTPVRSGNHRRSAGANRQSTGRLTTGIANNRPTSSPVADRWVKAAPIDSAESLKENRNQINTKKKFGFFGKKSTPSQEHLKSSHGESSKRILRNDKEQSFDDDTSTPVQGSDENLNETYLVNEQSKKQSEDPANETFVVAEKEETVQTSVILIETGVTSLSKVRGLKSDSFEMEKSVETVKDVKDRKGEEVPTASGTVELQDKGTGSRPKESQKIPLARMDSVDSTSMSSLNSDDLMLDLDLNMDDEMSQSTCSAMERSLTRPRALSDAVESGSLSRQERRPNPTRPRLSESGLSVIGLRGRNLLERQASDRQLRARGHSITTGEAVQELESLISNPTVQRRNPKLEHSTRPASFPGPLGSGGEDLAAVAMVPRSFSLKPPRQPSLVEDEDHISVDGYTYRHMQQDITTFKTMLLKLKRVIQDDELGSPMDPTYKNGIKYSFGSSSGTPDSPIVKTDESWKTALQTLQPPAPVSGPQLTEVVQENSELRQQLQTMEKKLEDQQQTIKLLQQQMDTVMKLQQRGYPSHNNFVNRNRTRIAKTKYECGHLGPGGCVYSNAATQTDKPRLGATARGGARGASRPSGGASSGASENVISSSATKELRNSTDKLAKGSNEKGRSLLQPSAHVKDKDPTDGIPRRNFFRSKDAKQSIGKQPQPQQNSVHLRPRSSTGLPSYSSTVPITRSSAGVNITTSRTSLDSQKSSSESRLSTDSGMGKRSISDPKRQFMSDRKGSIGTKSTHSTDTGVGIAELSPSVTPEHADKASVESTQTQETSGGNCSTSKPPSASSGQEGSATASQNKPPVSRLPGSRLARPYGAARGSRLATLLNRNATLHSSC